MWWIRRIVLAPIFRVLLYVLIVQGVHGLLGFAVRDPVGRQLTYSAIAVLAYLLMGRLIERKSPAEVGLGPRHMLRDTAAGFAITALLMSLVIGALALGGWYRVQAVRWDWGLVGVALLTWLSVSLFEELMIRGLFFRTLEESLGSWWALMVSALIFGVAHGLNPGATAVSTVAITLEAGILLGAAYLLTRTLWLAIGMHWAWHFMQGTIFGAPVSGNAVKSLIRPVIAGPEWATGGAFGPEAGLFGVVAGTAAGLWFLALAVRRGAMKSPFWRQKQDA